jgi:hypothetical protein
MGPKMSITVRATRTETGSINWLAKGMKTIAVPNPEKPLTTPAIKTTKTNQYKPSCWTA